MIRLRGGDRKDEPPTVEKFVSWLNGSEARSRDLGCERTGELAIWYCTLAEGAALWQRIHRVAEEEFYSAISGGTKYEIEAASWWLSRAMVSPQDIYLAAAGLKRAGVAGWDILLREGLRLKDKEQWREGLSQAEELIAHPPRFERAAPTDVIVTHYRDQVRPRSTLKPMSHHPQAAA